jgi:hypothetical protein
MARWSEGRWKTGWWKGLKVSVYVYNRKELKKLLRRARNCRILHMPMEWIHEFMIASCWNILRMRTVSDRSYRDEQNTHFMCNKFYFRKSCCSLDVEKFCRNWHTTDDNVIRRIPITCWKTNTTDNQNMSFFSMTDEIPAHRASPFSRLHDRTQTHHTQ